MMTDRPRHFSAFTSLKSSLTMIVRVLLPIDWLTFLQNIFQPDHSSTKSLLCLFAKLLDIERRALMDFLHSVSVLGLRLSSKV